MTDPEHIEAVRDFNRFYTSRLGMTRNGLHRTTHPLAEARVLYELGTHGVIETSALREALAIDAGQLSRLVKRLEEQGVITRLASPHDARRQQVQLTPQGRTTFERLDEGSKHEVAALLESLPDPEGAIAAMDALRRAIEDDRTVTIRDRQPGDLGWLVERHGVLYAREYGWDESFERLVAQHRAPTSTRRRTAPGSRRPTSNEPARSCASTTHPNEPSCARSWSSHTPAASASARRLVDEVIRHATTRGYTTLTLWTNDVLHAARHIYERAGFTLISEAPHHAFGHDLTEQTWSLTLHAWTETH